MQAKIILLSLSLIVVAFGSALAETKTKASTSHIVRLPAEKRLNGILRSTDKDHNPSEPFHIARSPAEKKLDDIIRRADKDKNMFEYVLGRPWYNAKKDTGYSRMFTKNFARSVSKMESEMVKESCGGKYTGEICGIDYSPIACGQDFSRSGYLYRTVEDDDHKATILSLGVDFGPEEIKTSHRLIKDGDDWKIDGVNCGGGGEFNMDCSNSVCAEDVPYFLKKAEEGFADAQYSLGVMYSLGRGELWNHAEAAKWFHKAAEQGHAGAQAYLGYIYYSDHQGVKKDNAEAVSWYYKAAEQGHADAQYHLGDMYKFGRGVAKNDAAVEKWFRKAAEQGHVQALSHLGPIYEEGRGVTPDYAEALKWYRKAAELGKADAQYHLGLMYEKGQGVTQDHAEAEKWFRMATEREHADARKKIEPLGQR